MSPQRPALLVPLAVSLLFAACSSLEVGTEPDVDGIGERHEPVIVASNGTTVLEAESLSFSSSFSGVASDANASGGKFLAFFANGTATGSLSSTTATELVVRARREFACGEPPRLQIRVDGEIALDVNVQSTAWRQYALKEPFTDGTHSISVAFLNDAHSSTCDVNVLVDQLAFLGSSATTTRPAIPTGLVATAGDARVTLDWNDNAASDQVTRYQVYRSTSATSGFVKIADGPTTSAYADVGLTNGTTYYYRVSALNSVGYGDWNDPVSVTPNSSPSGAQPLFEGRSVHNFTIQVSGSTYGSGGYDVADPAGSGEVVMQLRANERDASGGVVRAQAVGPSILNINGGEYWEVTGVYFPANFPTVQTWQAVYSYYGPPHNGSPPNIAGVHGNTLEYDLLHNGVRLWSKPLQKGVWLNFARRYRLSTGSDGWMEIYYSTGDNPLQLQPLSSGGTRWNGVTVSTAHNGGSNNFRISNYRDDGQAGFGDNSIFYRRVAIWAGSTPFNDVNARYFTR
jgi:hypothetical protein